MLDSALKNEHSHRMTSSRALRRVILEAVVLRGSLRVLNALEGPIGEFRAVDSVDMLQVQIDAELVGYYMASLHSSGRHYADLRHSPDALYLRGASAHFRSNFSDAAVDLAAALTCKRDKWVWPTPSESPKNCSLLRAEASPLLSAAGASLPTVTIPKKRAPNT